ncbi:hypothetical protein AVEN_231155-1 [Araneus ventricosus]|uniref:Uncharacterized protein n=1 Tax=Araneus ventricosus TaxID=182803 RepID=A0A4Y2TE83_ARAVE|nr:hypothetical protein AVEN_231155-1 [Araneus ventricosus]
MDLLHVKSDVEYQTPSRWCGVEVCRKTCRLRYSPGHLTTVQDDEVIRDIMKNALRMRKDMPEICRCFDDPMGNHISKNQVCNVNSFRDIMKNALRMRKDMAKIWGCFDDPMGQPYIQEPSL